MNNYFYDSLTSLGNLAGPAPKYINSSAMITLVLELGKKLKFSSNGVCCEGEGEEGVSTAFKVLSTKCSAYSGKFIVIVSMGNAAVAAADQQYPDPVKAYNT